ncbi:PEP-CTERM sorting domain-containing protein [Methylophilus methylotrophus]|uniref:PEP-CTERM sorting domain-containing protein n=1 Tax=Methylophilus methylotrophus TaxID=17 RepID=UPI0003712ECF|nr:PEP-CTERM sorting domain-containing protein [Methylophilus methylotrophus]
MIPNLQIAKTVKLIMLASTLILIAFSLNAQAALISYSNAGKDLVYSSVSNVTWTKDANLLKTMIEARGLEPLVEDILAVTPSISNTPNYLSPNGNYVLSIFDFNDGDISNISGVSTWFGALAFVNYLNHINYAGSNQWQLPLGTYRTWYQLVFNFGRSIGNGTTDGDELAELYYHELGRQQLEGFPDTDIFDQEQINANYWYGNESGSMTGEYAWAFNFREGDQKIREKGEQYFYYAWAITPGRISAVPEPESVVMMLVSLGLMAGVVRRKQKSFG